jgi:hypothetical protein
MVALAPRSQIFDIDLQELNEPFAKTVLYCALRMTGHMVLEGWRRKLKHDVVTMGSGGEMGAAGLFEFLHCGVFNEIDRSRSALRLSWTGRRRMCGTVRTITSRPSGALARLGKAHLRPGGRNAP